MNQKETLLGLPVVAPSPQAFPAHCGRIAVADLHVQILQTIMICPDQGREIVESTRCCECTHECVNGRCHSVSDCVSGACLYKQQPTMQTKANILTSSRHQTARPHLFCVARKCTSVVMATSETPAAVSNSASKPSVSILGVGLMGKHGLVVIGCAKQNRLVQRQKHTLVW